MRLRTVSEEGGREFARGKTGWVPTGDYALLPERLLVSRLRIFGGVGGLEAMEVRFVDARSVRAMQVMTWEEQSAAADKDVDDET